MKKPIQLDYINVDMPEAKDYLVFLDYKVAGYGTEAKAGNYGWVKVWNPRDKKEYTFYGDVQITLFDEVLDTTPNPSFMDIESEIIEQRKYESLYEEIKYIDETTPYWWIYAVVWNGKVIADVFSASAGPSGRVNAWRTSKVNPLMFLSLETVILDGQVRIISRKKAAELNLPEVYVGDI